MNRTSRIPQKKVRTVTPAFPAKLETTRQDTVPAGQGSSLALPRNDESTVKPLSVRPPDTSPTTAPLEKTTTPLDTFRKEWEAQTKKRLLNNLPTAVSETMESTAGQSDRYRWESQPAQAVRPQTQKPQTSTGSPSLLSDIGGFLKDNTRAGISTFNGGLARTADFFLPDVITPKPVQNVLDYYKAREEELTAVAAQNNAQRFGRIGSIAGGLYQGTVAAVPQAVTAFMSGGGSAAETAIDALHRAGTSLSVAQMIETAMKNPGFWTSFAQTAGRDYEQAKEDGAGELQAQAAAITGSLLNAGIEISDGLEKLAGSGRFGITDWAKSALGEGLEEVEQGIASNLVNKGIFDHDKEWFSMEDDSAVINPRRAVQEFAGGAFAGALLSGGSVAAQNVIGALNGYRQQNYSMLQQRDGGRTADFDAQYEHYYDFSRLGLSEGEIPAYQTDSPLDPLTVREAVVTGQDEGVIEALQTIQQLIEDQEVSDSALSQMLNLPETRAVTERLMGMSLEGQPQARDLVRTWQRMYREDLQQAMQLLSESEQRQAASQAERMPTLDELAETLQRAANGKPQPETQTDPLQALAVSMAEERQAIQNQKITSQDMAFQLMKDGSENGFTMQTYKNALLSKITRELAFGTPQYRRAAIVHRAIADNLGSLQMQKAADSMLRRSILLDLYLIHGPQDSNRAVRPSYDAISNSKLQNEDVPGSYSDAAEPQTVDHTLRDQESLPQESDTKNQLLMAKYRISDGSIDLEATKRDYRKFLQSVPEWYKIILEHQVDWVRYAVTDDPNILFAYNGKMDEIQYNPNQINFDEYDFRIANTHELAHRIDKFFVRSIEDPNLVAAVQNARSILDENPDFFIQYCIQGDRDGCLSDILSAICIGAYNFPMGHSTTYWNSNTQTLECFANIFTLEAINDMQKIQFLEEHFPELMREYRNLVSGI